MSCACVPVLLARNVQQRRPRKPLGPTPSLVCDDSPTFGVGSEALPYYRMLPLRTGFSQFLQVPTRLRTMDAACGKARPPRIRISSGSPTQFCRVLSKRKDKNRWNRRLPTQTCFIRIGIGAVGPIENGSPGHGCDLSGWATWASCQAPGTSSTNQPIGADAIPG